MGKPSTPAAPDYAGAAKETAAGNLDAARMATKANRINQVTPYGSLTYSQSGDDPDAGWTQTTNLTPQAQETLNKQQALSNQYADIAQTGLAKAREGLENPQLDLSALPARAMNVGQTAQDAIMSRLQPQFANQEEALRTRMANQGITLGSKAYGTEMQQQAQGRNDAMLQAALQGINLDQANRSSAMQEQAYMQDRPLNLINALRTGAQVQSPQFQQFAQQQTTAGPNMSQAVGQQYDASMDAYNAQAGQSAGLMKGLFGLATAPYGGTALGGLFGK
jgi:MarR-like DNA-binding transcriptional regulator SgrR of sgrS sRNA